MEDIYVMLKIQNVIYVRLQNYVKKEYE